MRRLLRADGDAPRITPPGRLRRGALASGAVLALTVTLAACGSDDETPRYEPEAASERPGLSEGDAASKESKQDGAASSKSAEGAQVELPAAGEDVSGPDLVSLLQNSMKSGRTAAIEVVVDAETGMVARGEVDYGADPPGMWLVVEMPDMPELNSEVRSVDGAVYMQMDTGQDGAEKWLKVTGDAAGLGVDQIDMASSLKRMADSLTEVKNLGEVKLDGETMLHFTAEADGSAALGGEPGAELQASYELWFDESGMLRQFSLTTDGVLTGTTIYSDWGKKVSVKAPPASAVEEMPAMPEAP